MIHLLLAVILGVLGAFHSLLEVIEHLLILVLEVVYGHWGYRWPLETFGRCFDALTHYPGGVKLGLA